MAIYVFSLITGYQFTGVDSTQASRNLIFEKTNHTVKYIYTQIPNQRELQFYTERGISADNILSAHLMLADNYDLSGNYKVTDKLCELKKNYGTFEIVESEKGIDLYKNGRRFASIILKSNREFFWEISYFQDEKLLLSEYYGDRLLYTDYFATMQSEEGLYAERVRSSFVNTQGKRVYDCIYGNDGQELYVFPNGMSYSKSQFLYKFIEKLNLTSNDIVFIDRPSFFDYVQPLFQSIKNTKIMVFLHSDHYFEKGEDPYRIYLSKEYYYWFKYSYKIDTFIVSTEEQKEALRNKLLEYGCHVPKMQAIETNGLCDLKFPKKNRKRYSILTVSRLTTVKKIEWIIASVIEAHKYNSNICLDIYGEGFPEYEEQLKELVISNHAEDYIRFMGFCDVSEVYQNYEVYISASLGETLGLSVLEAIGSGNAVIGFNVRYGNRLFIENEKNGRLVKFQVQESGNEEKVNEVIREMADAIVDVFRDDKKLQSYHEHSYKIAKQFLNEKIERKWLDLFKKNEKNMIYSFNLGIGWASSGVEYAQMYRARMFRNIGVEAKFVFMDMFPRENIQHMTENIGFLDSEIIWLYTYFTDTKISTVTYTLTQLEETFSDKNFEFSRDGKIARYVFKEKNIFYTVYMVDEHSNLVHRVELVSRGYLIRKDYFTYCRIYSEYYAPKDNEAHLYQRRFFNEDGTVAYEEIIDNDIVMYQFPDRLLCSKEELVGYMVSKLNLTDKDVVIIDRTTGIGQAILRNAGAARIGSIIHADHFSEGSTDENNILWNNYYEYIFSQHEKVDFYICATDAQKYLVEEQFQKYMGVTPNVVTIPVGSLAELKTPEGKRKPYSLITASRLASEKHVDWIVRAIANAKKVVPDITLDIYGKGEEEEKLRKLIEKLDCGEYVKLCGQQNLDDVYKNYEAYISGSTSEGFGLTLMEAIGSGLPIIGFDVRYGNQNFIDDGKNGYKIPVHEKMEALERIKGLTEAIIRLFTESDLQAFHQHSYSKAEEYLTKEVEKRWALLLK